MTTLTGTNTYTITIEGTDATAATASQLTAISNATTVAVDASAVSGLAADNLSNIETLLIAGDDTTLFTADSFSLLEAIAVSDSTLDVSELNDAIGSANTLTLSLIHI